MLKQRDRREIASTTNRLPSDGRRIRRSALALGSAKEKAKVDHWAKDISPSNELRKWYGHDPAKWDEFRKYFAELDRNAAGVEALDRAEGKGTRDLPSTAPRSGSSTMPRPCDSTRKALRHRDGRPDALRRGCSTGRR